MKKFFSSTKNKFILFLLIPLVICAYFISTYAQKEGVELIIKQKENLLSLIVRNISDSFDELMGDRAREIQMIASSYIVTNKQISLKEKQALFEKMKKSYKHYAWIGMTDTKGNIIAGTNNLLVGKNVAKRSWFIHGSKGLHMGDVHDAFLLAKIMPKPKWDDLPLRLVDISVPIYSNDGEFLGVICGHLGWDWAFEIRSKIKQKLDDKNIDILVLKSDSSLLLGNSKIPSHSIDLSTQQSYILSKNKQFGVVKEIWPDTNEMYLSAFAHNNPKNTDNIKWIIIARENLKFIQEQIDTLKNKILLTFLVFSFALILFVGYIINHLLNPIINIAKKADEIGDGNDKIILPTFNNNQEANILSKTLNSLIAKLRCDLEKEKEYAHKLEVFERIINDAPFGILITDKDNTILSINHAYEKITGYSKEEVIGYNPKILRSGKHDKKFYEKMWHKLLESGQWQGEIYNKRKNGEIFSELLTIGVIKNENEIKNFVAIFSDITEMKRDKEKLKYFADYDSLTNVYNRGKIKSILKNYIEKDAIKSCSLIYIDLDYFKKINDTLGHGIGDKVLREICTNISNNFKDADLGRFGGDEFLLIFPYQLDKKAILKNAREVLKIIRTPLVIDNCNINISATLGISIYPNDAKECEDLIGAADIAMYSIKKKRELKNKIAFFTQALKKENSNKNYIIEEMKKALRQNDFSLVYQPQINSLNNQLVGIETLIRWKHETLGYVSPELFIKIAEEVGLISEIDEWVMDNALAQWKKWQSVYDMKDLHISINVSVIDLKSKTYAMRLKNKIKKLNIEPRNIALEITESTINEESLHVKENLEKLSMFGCKIAVDDFGMGYSNLKELKSIKFDILKIDKEFVSAIFDDDISKEIIKFAVDISKSLDLNLIAEGAEREEEVKELEKLGCTCIQGYFYSKPLEQKSIEKYFKI
jgi:diguanylate cyclase (GGDEF)-like protein/PAS domain S-box-containing protein